jgi:flagellar M-ring protein FliF
MNFELNNLFDAALKAPARTKLVVVLSIVTVLGAFGIGSWLSSRPHFVKLYTELSDAERVAVEKSLAEAQIRYRVSDFPGPFVIYVDEPQFDQAQIAVALSESLKTQPKGIDSSASGASTIFLSAGERAQSMQKREWQETEHLLEQLEFVTDATVTTSMPDTSPLRAKKPVQVSVALALKGVGDLTTEQAANVAKLVRFRFGVPAENVIITDQSGRTLHDPTADEDGGRMSREFLAQAEDYERELAAKANRHLEQTFGARKALVTVTSQWNYDQSTIIDEKIDPETVALQVDTKETSTPLGSASGAGGVTGVSATAPSEFGNESAAVPTAPVAAGSAQTSKTKDQKTTYEASRSRTQTVRTVPRLERLFVSLTLDESLSARRAEIQKIVEAAVGFDSSRQDIIGVTTTAFAAPEVAADSTPSSQGNGTTAVEDEGPSAMTQLLIERGVEIAAAVAFLALLFTSLRGSRKEGGSELAGAATAATSGGGPGGDASIDPEALARAQIEELVRTDPRRVGEILSRWVDEKATAKV